MFAYGSPTKQLNPLFRVVGIYSTLLEFSYSADDLASLLSLTKSMTFLTAVHVRHRKYVFKCMDIKPNLYLHKRHA